MVRAIERADVKENDNLLYEEGALLTCHAVEDHSFQINYYYFISKQVYVFSYFFAANIFAIKDTTIVMIHV